MNTQMEGAKRITIRDTIKVSPRYLGSNTKTHVIQQVKAAYEDKCTLHGYVLPATLEDLAIRHMAVEQATLNGFVNVSVEFTAMVWNPPEKSTVMATVKTANNFGILCTVDVSGREVMHIIVPKQIASIRSTKDLSLVRPGSKLEVVIVKRKMSYKADVLSAIGIVTSDAKLIHDETDADEIDESHASEDDALEVDAEFDDLLEVDDVIGGEGEEEEIDLLIDADVDPDAVETESDEDADADEDDAGVDDADVMVDADEDDV